MSNPEEVVEAGRRDSEFFNGMTLEQKQQWAKDIIKRMMQATGVYEKKGLAQMIGCHQNMPSNWLQKGSVPWKVVYLCHRETGVSLDWLYNGVEPAVVISPEVQRKLKNAVTELLEMAEREKLITQLSDDNFEAIAIQTSKEMIELLTTP
jgi:hypothetical protein